MAITKLISDFDGVWTNQDIEANYVKLYIIRRISDISGINAQQVENILDESRIEMDKSPFEFGWRNCGHIACYYQEDPFGDNNAIFDYIDKHSSTRSYSKHKQNLAKIKQSVLQKTSNNSLLEFSNECFVLSTTQFKLEGKLKPVKTAGEVIKALNKKGVEVVVVSNSKTEKIEHLFRKAGLKVTNEKAIVRGKLHAIGDAQKYIIDDSFKEIPAKLTITKRFHPMLRRRNYFNILLEENADYVLGDVFSLDLALPLYLRLNDKRFSKLKVIQRVQPHTPLWVKDYLGSKELEGIAFMVNSIDELPDLIARSVATKQSH